MRSSDSSQTPGCLASNSVLGAGKDFANTELLFSMNPPCSVSITDILLQLAVSTVTLARGLFNSSLLSGAVIYQERPNSLQGGILQILLHNHDLSLSILHALWKLFLPALPVWFVCWDFGGMCYRMALCYVARNCSIYSFFTWLFAVSLDCGQGLEVKAMREQDNLTWMFVVREVKKAKADIFLNIDLI